MHSHVELQSPQDKNGIKMNLKYLCFASILPMVQISFSFVLGMVMSDNNKGNNIITKDEIEAKHIQNRARLKNKMDYNTKRKRYQLS